METQSLLDSRRRKELESLIQLKSYLNSAQQETPHLFYEPTLKLLPFHKSEAQQRWIVAANRVGKSEAGSQEAVWYMLGEHPYKTTPAPPVSGWAVSLDYPASVETAQEKILKKIPPREIASWNKNEGILKLRNGSKLGFKSCDSGWKKFQGAEKDFIWFDEEPPNDVWKEAIIRWKRNPPDIWVTMTPVEGMTWTYSYLTGKNSEKSDIDIFGATIWDNPYLNHSEIEKLTSSYSEEELQIRLYGKYVNLSGHCVFSKKALSAYMERTATPKFTGFIHEDRHGKLTWEENKNGFFRIIF